MKELLFAIIINKTCKNVYSRDHYRCAICDGSRAIQIRRVIPQSHGGSSVEQDLITLCTYCHGEVHGTHFLGMPDWMDQEYMEQAIAEYMADTYAETFGKIWWPYEDKG